VIEHVHIQLTRVMSGYSVRAAFSGEPAPEDQADDIVLLHGFVEPDDLESPRSLLEHLAEELFNLAPRFRGMAVARSLAERGMAAAEVATGV
jgi:hypothetical protein